MKFNNRENTCHIIDGREVWETRSVAVHGLIIIGTEINDYLLLTKRSDKCPDEQGKFANVTGYLDWDETLQEALTREMWEEVGLDLRSLIANSTMVYGSDVIPQHVDSIPEGRQNVTVRFEMGLRTSVLPPIKESDEVSMSGFYPLNTVIDMIQTPGTFAWDHARIISGAISRYKYNTGG